MSGILRLESLTKGNTLKQGDKTPLKYRLFDADGEKLNIAGKSAKVRLVYPDFLTIGYEKDGLTVAQDDTVTFTIDNVIPSRIYHVEIIVDDKFIFPSRADESKFTVDKSSLGTESNIVEIVGVDAVVRKAVDLINQDPSLIIDEDKLVTDIISNTGIGSINEYYKAFNDLKPKAEQSITKSAEALTKSQNALNVANGIDAKATNALSLSESADTLSKSVQEQFNQVIIDGDSSVEAAQARVDASGQTNPTLKARLDKEHNEVTAQLAQNEHYMNQLQNIFMEKGLDPYWIETAVEFGFTLGGVPEGISNYEGGNYYLEVSGNEGDNFVTVTGGNIAHAGQTTSWAGVIKDDSGNWKPYRVLGTNGVDQVNIYPPLKTNISNGELANVHDAKVGQHYTERGYFALAQHIYNYSPFYADRNKVISKFNPSTDDLERNKWKHVDVNPVISVGSIVNSSGILVKEGNNTLFLEGAGGKTLESYYELELKGKKGFVETHVRTGNTQMIVEFYLDDELVEVIEAKPSILNKIKFRFENADSAKLRVYLQNTTSWSDLAIGRTTWYETDEDSTIIIPPHSRLVYLGDSWGEFHNRAVSRELSRLLTEDSGTTVEVFNDSVGGMTSKWGKAWFEEYVIKNKPTHVIIEFFTNDLNSISNSLPYDYVAPDGNTYSGKIESRDEWLNNIKQMVDISKRYGIQPIIVAPAVVEGDSQMLRHLTASNLMFD